MTSISGHTKLAAVIGSPVAHSFSPLLMNAAFQAAELDWVYLAFDVVEGDAASAFAAMRSLGIQGYSVTMPHKDAAAAEVDELTPAAAALGAVNCVSRSGDRLIGHNTDGVGLVGGLEHDTGVDVTDTRFVVVGAGGAARAAVYALADAGAPDIAVLNRTEARAVVAAELGGAQGRVGGPSDLAAADVVINATSVGMAATASAGDVAFDVGALHDHAIVYDLIYHPLATPTMEAARQRSLVAHNGVSMLAHQAAAAFELWTAETAPIEAMHAAVSHHLGAGGT